MARKSRRITVWYGGIQIGDPVDADEPGVKQSHKLFSESFQAQEQVGRFRQKKRIKVREQYTYGLRTT
jgi:hypothetical protein